MATDWSKGRTGIAYSPITMMSYERLDAWKVAHELAVAVYRATNGVAADRREDIVSQLRLVSILAPAKLAHGSSRRSRKTFRRFVEIAIGCLAELGYHVRLAGQVGLLSNSTVQRLDAQRGRAAFYAWKLYVSLAPTPDPGSAD